MLSPRGLTQEVGLQGSRWEMVCQAYVVPLSWHSTFLFLKSLTHPLRLMGEFIRSGQMLRKIFYPYSDSNNFVIHVNNGIS